MLKFDIAPIDQMVLKKKPKVSYTKGHPTNNDYTSLYIDEVLNPVSNSLTQEAFNTAFSEYKSKIIVTLGENQFEQFSYHPHKFFKEYNVARARVGIFTELGPIVDKYIETLGDKEKIWVQALKKVQDAYPDRVNIFHKKKPFTGMPFPNEYYWAHNASPRWLANPPHTGRDGFKPFRFELCQAWAKRANIYILDVDLSSCHARIITLFLNEKQAPLLHKSFKERDLYGEIGTRLFHEFEILAVVTVKGVRKICKIYSLACLNGANSGAKEIISDILSMFVDPKHPQFDDILKLLYEKLNKRTYNQRV